MIIKIDMCGVRFEGSTLIAAAGTSLQQLLRRSVEKNLSGLEFVWGIPGSVAGAVVMNAGAGGDEIGERVESVTALDRDGRIIKIAGHELGFSYRLSNIPRRDRIITEIELELGEDSPLAIQKRLEKVKQMRKHHQPEHPSAGCVFKNPKGVSAGKLIDNCGLKGFQQGGAEVWNQHANFIINRSDASCDDVKKLMQLILEKVQQVHNVLLEPEIVEIDDQR